MRRALAATVLLLAACDPQQDGGTTSRRPGPGHEQPPVPVPEANAPGPQSDPGACDDRGKRDIELHASWVSENTRTPRVMWTHNGKATPAANLSSHRLQANLGYAGEWSTLVSAVCHDTFSVVMEAAPGQDSGICAIFDLGNGPVINGKNCRAEYVVP